jgi:Tol biopolymer transport system component
MSRGPWKDLAWGGLFLLGLVGVSLGAYGWLGQVARRTEALPLSRYEQPVWSQDEEQVAYILRRVPPGGDLDKAPAQLWTVSRFGQQARRIAELPSSSLRLLGWAEQGRSLVLVPGQPRAGPEAYVVSADGSSLRHYRFSPDLAPIPGAFQGELFFQRCRGEGALQEIDILAWEPGRTEVRRLVTLPGSSAGPVQVHSALPSPDGDRLALVLQVAGSPAGLWICDRQTGKLQFSLIKAATSLRPAWSPDGASLVALAPGPDGCDLFVLREVAEGVPLQLTARGRHADYSPVWPGGQGSLLLVAPDSVLRFDFASEQAQLLLDRHQVGSPLRDLSISPLGVYAAFCVTGPEGDELYQVDLTSRQRRPLLGPDLRRQGMDSLVYRIASGTRWAVARWRDGGMLSLWKTAP